MKFRKADNSWNKFSELLDSTPRGNFGNMAVHFPMKEIIPAAQGVLRWNKKNQFPGATIKVIK